MENIFLIVIDVVLALFVTCSSAQICGYNGGPCCSPGMINTCNDTYLTCQVPPRAWGSEMKCIHCGEIDELCCNLIAIPGYICVADPRVKCVTDMMYGDSFCRSCGVPGGACCNSSQSSQPCNDSHCIYDPNNNNYHCSPYYESERAALCQVLGSSPTLPMCDNSTDDICPWNEQRYTCEYNSWGSGDHHITMLYVVHVMCF